MRDPLIKVGWCVTALAIGAETSALACATCYGASDSPLAEGMNWGIATLLGVIGAVLAGVVAFFVHVGVRSARGNDTGGVRSDKNT